MASHIAGLARTISPLSAISSMLTGATSKIPRNRSSDSRSAPLGAPDLGDVTQGADKQPRAAVRVADGGAVRLGPDDLPVLAQQALLHRVGADLAGYQPPKAGHDGIAVGGMDDVRQPQRSQLVAGIAGDLAEALVDPDELEAGPDVVDADRRVVEQGAQPPFRL